MKKEKCGFTFKAESCLDEAGNFLGIVKFLEVDSNLRGIGLVGEHNGIEVRSAAYPELSEELRQVFIPGSFECDDQKGATTRSFPFFLKAIEALTAVQKELADKQPAIPSKVMKDFKESLRGNIKFLRQTIDDWESIVDSTDDPERLTTFKGVFLNNLLERLPVYATGCYHCRLKDFTNSNCYNCAYGAKHGLCSDDKSDWFKMRTLLSQLREAVNTAYIPD